MADAATTGRRGVGRTARPRVALLAALALLGPAAGGGRAQDAPPPAEFGLIAYQGADVLGGERLLLSDLLALGRPVVINFWGGLCPPCREEMPAFQRVYDDLGDRFTLVGVDLGPFFEIGSHEDALAFLDAYDIRYPAGYSPNPLPIRAFGVRGLPTTVFLRADGVVADKVVGALTEAQLRERLAPLLPDAP